MCFLPILRSFASLQSSAFFVMSQFNSGRKAFLPVHVIERNYAYDSISKFGHM